MDWSVLSNPPGFSTRVADLAPAVLGGVFIEPKFHEGNEELFPVVPLGVTRVNGEFVVLVSHWGGTVKVTGRPRG